jgi:hypothetical protein
LGGKLSLQKESNGPNEYAQATIDQKKPSNDSVLLVDSPQPNKPNKQDCMGECGVD